MNGLQRTMGVVSRLAPRLAARVASLLFTLPRRHRRPARERLALERGVPRVVRAGGLDLAAWEWGSGPLVLLAHGWEGRGSQMGSFVQPLVDAGFRVVAFDQAGHGDSPGRLSSLHGFAEALRAAADQLGPLHGVVAHSFGAMATTIALGRGLRLESVVFVGPAAWTDHSVAHWATLLGVNDAVIAEVQRRSEARHGIHWADLLGRNLGHGRREPALIIHDRGDAEVSFEAAQALAGSWEGARFVATEGLGHRRILHDPAVLAQTSVFLRSGYAPPIERLREAVSPWEAFLSGGERSVA